MAKREHRIGMLSAEDSLEVAKSLDMYEPIARLNIFRVLLHRPKTAKAISDLLLSLLFDSEIGHRRRELIIMRIGWVTGSEYEWTQHWPLAQEMFECCAEELLALRDWTHADCFDETDRAVLTATDELLETGDLSDSTWQACFSALGRDAAIGHGRGDRHVAADLEGSARHAHPARRGRRGVASGWLGACCGAGEVNPAAANAGFASLSSSFIDVQKTRDRL